MRKGVLKNLMVLFCAVSLFACKKTNEAEVIREQLMNDVLGKTFIIKEYNENGTDKTTLFETTTLTFKANDEVIFHNVAKLEQGVWKVLINENNNASNGYSFLYFSIKFEPSFSSLIMITADWDILDFTGTELKLVNDANFLTLEELQEGA